MTCQGPIYENNASRLTRLGVFQVGMARPSIVAPDKRSRSDITAAGPRPTLPWLLVRPYKTINLLKDVQRAGCYRNSSGTVLNSFIQVDQLAEHA